MPCSTLDTRRVRSTSTCESLFHTDRTTRQILWVEGKTFVKGKWKFRFRLFVEIRLKPFRVLRISFLFLKNRGRRSNVPIHSKWLSFDSEWKGHDGNSGWRRRVGSQGVRRGAHQPRLPEGPFFPKRLRPSSRPRAPIVVRAGATKPQSGHTDPHGVINDRATTGRATIN